jgi:hypothetical protein|tara:strand:- start:215 stop:358 length:144 start_codon:yes stop_codon:yes gene_type:complete
VEVGKNALFVGGMEFKNKTITGKAFQSVKENSHLDNGTKFPFANSRV